MESARREFSIDMPVGDPILKYNENTSYLPSPQNGHSRKRILFMCGLNNFKKKVSFFLGWYIFHKKFWTVQLFPLYNNFSSQTEAIFLATPGLIGC